MAARTNDGTDARPGKTKKRTWRKLYLAKRNAARKEMGPRVRELWRVWSPECTLGLVIFTAFAIWTIPLPDSETLRDWQQAIGAVIGFLALAGAALLNYSLMRRRDSRLAQENAQRIRRALLSELENTRGDLQFKSEWLRSGSSEMGKSDNLQQMKIGRFDVFDNLVDRIDVLTPDECKSLVDTHHTIMRINKSLEWLAGNLDKSKMNSGEVTQNVKVLVESTDIENKLDETIRTLYRQTFKSA